jgi:DNA-binding YbaB/EbfC family protein
MKNNPGGMMKGLVQMQQRVNAIQTEIAAAEFEGSAAGGLVKVRINGKGELLRVDFDPSVFSEDRETVGDLVVVASRVAHEAKEAMVKQKTASIASGLLPLGMKIPGLG